MRLDRRQFLAATSALAFPRAAIPGASAPDWRWVREQFELAPEVIHLAGMLLAAHPRPVREAIARHRHGLDENPALYANRHNRRLEREARAAAARYLGAEPDEVALTDSTTMGLGLVYAGVELGPGDEVLSTAHNYYSTRAALTYKARASGAVVREVPEYERIEEATEESLVERIASAIGPRTRVVALTWVHSSTGLKLPLRAIADRVAKANAGRPAAERALLCVDGVHALGVEDFEVGELGCDLFVAGTHKWLFGPRGTGVVWGRPSAHDRVHPTIPTFTRGAGWGGGMTPGGFHSFEHRWALTEAFDFHLRLGKARVAERVHALTARLKAGLAKLPRVALRTPLDERLTAGIVCFEVKGLRPETVVARLQQRGVIASVTPYEESYARLSPCVFNTPEEIDRALEIVGGLR